jgi:hypothetical protein
MSNQDVQSEVTQAFDNIVNLAWEGAKTSEAGELTQKRTYQLLDDIQKSVTSLKRILYTHTID